MMRACEAAMVVDAVWLNNSSYPIVIILRVVCVVFARCFTLYFVLAGSKRYGKGDAYKKNNTWVRLVQQLHRQETEKN